MSVTRQEQGKAQEVAGFVDTPYRHRADKGNEEETYTDLIASRAKAYPKGVQNNLVHYFTVENLRLAYGEIEGSKAVGSDGITKKKYGENLDENLENLHQQMRKMAYRPADAKLILIPKPEGRSRPIAISNFEDKLVQKVMANVLTALYDQTFHRFSFGFRPKRNAHGAIGYLYNKLRRHNLPWVVDVDLKDFFNTIDHKNLMEVLKIRISDSKLLRYIVRMLKAGILVEGHCRETTTGTPQGSIVSPILANIYLHHVLDEWFVKTIRPEAGGKMVRYADDVVAAFASEDKAKEFVRRLEERLKEFGLSLNLDKTRIVFFDRNHENKETFDFLGFTYYWGKSGTGFKGVLKVKTSMKALTKKIQNFVHWIKENRSRYKQALLMEKVIRKLRGHYQYYGVLWNRGKLYHFYHEVVRNLFRWLNRRSQKISYTWEGFKMLLKMKPLPLPAESWKLIDLTDVRLYCV